MDSEKIIEKNNPPLSKIKKILRMFGFVIIVIFLIFLAMALIYFIEIKPHSNNEINVFEERIRNITDPEIKIREIANFTEENYYQAYGKKPIFSSLEIHVFDDPRKIRIRSRLFFANDPYFIAYFKTGACGESAALLNFIANKSGFESRIVGTSAEDHQWNELKINERWVQVDPTIYYYYYTDPENFPTYKDLWFDNPQAYSNIGWYQGGYSSVSVFGTHEDLSIKYCNTSKLSISCQGCDHIKIIPVGRGISIDQDMHDEVTYNLGKMNYSVLVDKTIIPYLLVNEKNVTISLTGDKSVNISSSPEEIRPTFYTQLLFALVVIGVFIAGTIFILLFIFQMGVEFYEKWKIKKIDKNINASETSERRGDND